LIRSKAARRDLADAGDVPSTPPAMFDAHHPDAPAAAIGAALSRDDDDAFSFSVPGSDVPARVGRHDLARTLTLALAQELDAAWPGA